MINKFLAISLFTYCLFPFFVDAQVTTQNKYGKYGSTKTLEGEYSGSIYLYDEWKLASIRLTNEKIEKVKVKYNLLDDLFYVQGSDGNPVTFEKPYNEVSIDDADGNTLLFRRYTNAAGEFAFFQVLFDDKVQLLKKDKVSFIEMLNYNDVSAKKKVIKQTKFYAQYKNREMSELKISKKNILNFMADRKADILTFMDKQNINLKSDPDLVKLLLLPIGRVDDQSLRAVRFKNTVSSYPNVTSPNKPTNLRLDCDSPNAVRVAPLLNCQKSVYNDNPSVCPFILVE